MLKWLKGKKTIIGGLLLSALSAMYFLDMMDGQASLLTEQQYLAIAGIITGITGVAMRLGVGKAERPDGRP